MADDPVTPEDLALASLVADELYGRDWELESHCVSAWELGRRLHVTSAEAAASVRRLVRHGYLKCHSSLPEGDTVAKAQRLVALSPTRKFKAKRQR